MSEEDGAVYGRLQDAWLEMCTTYLEMVRDLSSDGREEMRGQDWEGEGSLQGMFGQLEKEGDKRLHSHRETPAENIEENSCGEKKVSISNSVRTTEETTDEAEHEVNGMTKVPNPVHDDKDKEGETQDKPDFEDIVDAKLVPEKDGTAVTDENSAEDQIELPSHSDVELIMAVEGEIPPVSGKISPAKEDNGDHPCITNQGEEEIDIMSENDNALRVRAEKDKTESEEKEKRTSVDDVIEAKEKCDIDVPNNEAGQKEGEETVEHIIIEGQVEIASAEKDETVTPLQNVEDTTETAASSEDQTESTPFSFSDFALQPNRPDSPNMSEGSDPEEEGGVGDNKGGAGDNKGGVGDNKGGVGDNKGGVGENGEGSKEMFCEQGEKSEESQENANEESLEKQEVKND